MKLASNFAGRQAAAMSLMVALSFWSLSVLAQIPPPPNDLCSGAITIPNGSFPVLTTTVNITNATLTGDPPLTFPTNCVSEGTISNLSRSVWYKFQPAMPGRYVISTSAKRTATRVQDTVMAVYTASGNCTGFNPMMVACNDDAGDLCAAVATDLAAGTVYYIVVWASHFDPFVSGTSLQLFVDKPPPPDNDTCVTAKEIPTNGPFPHLTTITDTILATSDGDPTLLAGCQDVSRSVWYKFRPTTGGPYVFTTCTNQTGTTIDDTVMALYRASGDCAGLVPLICNDDTCGARSAIAYNLEAGTLYYILVWEYGFDDPIPTETKVQLGVLSNVRPLIVQPEMLSSGSFRLRFTGIAGLTYTVLGSTDLINWTKVGTPSYLGGDLFIFTHNATGGTPYRFYRVRLP